jgi:hypothetical protein
MQSRASTMLANYRVVESTSLQGRASPGAWETLIAEPAFAAAG